MKTCHTPYGSEGVEEETGLYLYGTEEKRNGRWEGGCIHIEQKKRRRKVGVGEKKAIYRTEEEEEVKEDDTNTEQKKKYQKKTERGKKRNLYTRIRRQKGGK